MPRSPGLCAVVRACLRAYAIAAAIAAPTVVAAQTAALENAPIQVESDRAEFSEDTGTTVFTGAVVLRRGPLVLRGERLVVRRLDDGSFEAALTGSPAQLHREPDAESDNAIDGHAQRVEYFAAANRLVLTGDAHIERNGEAISGESISHDLDSRRTEATRGEDGDRVHITLQPDRIDDEDDSASAAESDGDGDASGEPGDAPTNHGEGADR